MRRPPRSTLFPSTTLFRSRRSVPGGVLHALVRAAPTLVSTPRGRCATAATAKLLLREPLVVCGKQNSEYALDCGAANPGCRRLSAGACGDRRLAHVRKSRLKGG